MHRAIQDFINAQSPRMQCLEGALLAAASFWCFDQRPLLMDLRANDYDYDHVVALYRFNGYWGAISKTKYPVLRYREPVYRSVRELAMSYFHEYFLDDGSRTLRSYSDPFDLSLHFGSEWVLSLKHRQKISRALDRSPHHEIVPRSLLRKMRLADEIEIRAGKIR